MEKVNGIGGLFFRAKDPDGLDQWYLTHLGILLVPKGDNEPPWWQEAWPSGIGPFPEATEYFGDPKKTWMVQDQSLRKRLGREHRSGLPVPRGPWAFTASCGHVHFWESRLGGALADPDG